MSTTPTSLTLFCKVIDNYGDIGICWRLARQLTCEHSLAVTLWVDDLHSFKRICPEINVGVDTQQIDQVTIRHWCEQNVIPSLGPSPAPLGHPLPLAGEGKDRVTDIVIEFFGCDLPPAYLTAMATRQPHPVWLNLEGLSAESWVEGCHKLPSPHPTSSLIKHFFFPGFTDKTGGLLLEADLHQQRQQFQQDPAAMTSFLTQLGVTPAEMIATKVSLFCYSSAPVSALFDAWKNSAEKVTCLVPEGVASEVIQTFLGQDAKVGASVTKGALTVRVIPFLSQPGYDKLLWACDLNFVRGEDSFVRAQWAARPFIWQIYPQDKDLHHVKLNAFLERLTAKTNHLVALSLAWNEATKAVDFATLWPLFKAELSTITELCPDWQRQLAENGDLAANLMKFVKELRYNLGLPN